MSTPVPATLDGCARGGARAAAATATRACFESASPPRPVEHRPGPVATGPCLDRRRRRRPGCQAVARVHWARALRGLAVAFGAGALAMPAGAATYAVAPAGSDAAAGTAAAPFRTLDRLNRASLRPGDVVVLQAGATFTGTLELEEPGMATAPITVTSSGPGRAVIDGRWSGRTLVDIAAA